MEKNLFGIMLYGKLSLLVIKIISIIFICKIIFFFILLLLDLFYCNLFLYDFIIFDIEIKIIVCLRKKRIK